MCRSHLFSCDYRLEVTSDAFKGLTLVKRKLLCPCTLKHAGQPFPKPSSLVVPPAPPGAFIALKDSVILPSVTNFALHHHTSHLATLQATSSYTVFCRMSSRQGFMRCP